MLSFPKFIKKILYLNVAIILLFFCNTHIVLADFADYIADYPDVYPDWLTPALYDQVSADIWLVNTAPSWNDLFSNLNDIIDKFAISSATEFVAVYDIINTSPWANNGVFLEIAWMADINSVSEFVALDDYLPIGTNLSLIRKVLYYASPPVTSVEEIIAFFEDGRDISCELAASQSSYQYLSNCPGHEDDPPPEPSEDPELPEGRDDNAPPGPSAAPDATTITITPNFQQPSIYVPVNDLELNLQLYQYHTDFYAFTVNFENYRINFYNYWADMLDWIETDTDSLKNLLASGDPGGIADEACITRLINPNDPTDPDATASYNVTLAFNLDNVMFGPMLDPEDFDNKTVAENPQDFVRVFPLVPTTVNDGVSLRCLLQELVEWRKLDLNLSIHDMMKSFITDAQSYLFAKQMQSHIVAGFINWSQLGIEQQLSPDKTTHSSVFVANREKQVDNKAASIRQNVASHIQGETGGFIPFDIYEPFRKPIENSFRRNTLTAQTADIELLASQMKHSLFDVFDDEVAVTDQLAGDFTTAGWDGYANLLLRAENNPLTAMDIAENNLALQYNQLITDESSMQASANGFIDITICVDSNDPWCRVRQVITPAFVSQQSLAHTMEAVGGDALTQTDEPGENPSDTTTELQTDIVTTGSLKYYESNDLRTESPDFNSLYTEFYEEIMHGYYDLDGSDRKWAQNALSEITDTIYYEMIEENYGTFGPDY